MLQAQARCHPLFAPSGVVADSVILYIVDPVHTHPSFLPSASKSLQAHARWLVTPMASEVVSGEVHLRLVPL